MNSGIEIKSVSIFFKAGFDDKCVGACYQSHRILMLCELKCNAGLIPEFHSIPVNKSKPCKEFKELGVHLRIPALYFKTYENNFEPIDSADDMILELDNRYPGGVIASDLETDSESVTRDFYSKFCYWMRGVAKDGSHLESELIHINAHLGKVSQLFPEANKLFLCGDQPAIIDCEVLPKLHQIRVAAHGIKGYELPRELTHIWRYLHSAYTEPAFVKHCPSDTEILLHWLDTDHPGTLKLSPRQQQLLAASSGKSPSFSFSVPALATKVVIE